MKRKDVVQTFKTLLATYPGLAPADVARVAQEFTELLQVGPLKPDDRRRLLEVVHSCRALESTLDILLVHFGIVIPDKQKSLGSFLSHFNSAAVVGPGKLTDKIDGASKLRYQDLVNRVRNNMMHRAGAYPASEKELDGFLSVLNAWLFHIFALT